MSRRPRRKEVVPEEERRKSAFLEDYADLCRAHSMAVVMDENEADYRQFFVADIKDPDFLERCLEEMRIGEVMELIPEDNAFREMPDADS